VLGSAGGGVVTLDARAAGHSWFVDATPLDHSEFTSGSRLSTLDSRLRMDLLTAVMHELGHVLGHSDLDPASHVGELMSATLAPGTRSVLAADAIFGSGEWAD
jgi:large repetitive protein